MKIIKFTPSTSPSVIVENAPLNFVRSGYYDWSSGQLYDRGAGGRYWSTATFSSTSACNFYFRSDDLRPQDGDYKNHGFSVRCAYTPMTFSQDNQLLCHGRTMEINKLEFFNQPKCNSRECTIELCEEWLL